MKFESKSKECIGSLIKKSDDNHNGNVMIFDIVLYSKQKNRQFHTTNH